jgi:galactan 5-O-arabinofuranosyltransferase
MRAALRLTPARRRAGAMALEVVASLVAAAWLTLSARGIRVDPLVRVGQVSGLAGIGPRFTLAGLVLVALLGLASRVRGGAAFGIAARVACGALAGLATGFVAAGILVALRGTPWCLNADWGDSGRLIKWANAVLRKEEYPFYPPLPVHTIALYSRAFGLPAGFALKHLQIIGTALVGPLAYLSWRLLLPPIWALGIGVLAAMPLVDPYKPYANSVLIALVPALVYCFRWVQRAGELDYRRLCLLGVGVGVGFTLLYYCYYGWFQWSAPGAVIAAALVFPWRDARARPRAAVLLGLAGLSFIGPCAPLLVRALREGFADNYFYFDTNVDPAYFAMWRWDLAGTTTEWPPPGELGGVGLFTLLLALALGVSIALGRGDVLVTTVAWLIGGTWVLRYWYAQRMYATQLVQLYPRTTIELVYCSLVLCGYAAYLVAQRFARRRPAETPNDTEQDPDRPASYVLGAVCALLLVLGSAGSAMADRYMPANDTPQTYHSLAWQAHHTRAVARPVR